MVKTVFQGQNRCFIYLILFTLMVAIVMVINHKLTFFECNLRAE